MGSKRKSTSSKAKRAARQRAAVHRRSAPGQSADPGWGGETDWPLDDGSLPEWKEFLDHFPDLSTAVAAAEAGELVEVFSDNDSTVSIRQRVLITPNGPVIERTVYPHYDLRDLLVIGWLNHPAPREEDFRAVLAEFLPEPARHEGITVISEPSTTQVPRFAYQYRFPVASDGPWGDVEPGLAPFAPLEDAMSFLCTGAADVTVATDALFARHGIPLVRCAECDHALTDRHPLWPGLWIDLEEETGPSCERGSQKPDGYAQLDNYSYSRPHQPDPAALV